MVERCLVATPRRGAPTRLALALVLVLAACGSSNKGDTYAAATSAQEACCEHLDGEPRDQCLAQVVRVDDPEVAKTDVNRATFACVRDHFACDKATGQATAESRQAQYDCMQDLGK